ncbi:YHS domain-containing protein [Chloroflexota bacterium]
MRASSAKLASIVLVLLAVAVLVWANGCALEPSPSPTPTAVDPVCGSMVDMAKAEEAGLTSVCQGATYYFCMRMCREKFEQMPMMYFDKCAVCGTLVQRAGTLTSACMGKTYYLCTAKCKEAFDKEAEAYVAKLATDPVCGMTVDIAKAEEAGLTSVCQGATYYFCMRMCREKFEQDSAKYIVVEETAVDPVCRMTVVKKDAEAQGLTSVYKGMTYYFCMSDCKHYFDRDPERYLK